MKAHTGGFLDLEPRFSDPESAAVVILPVPYEGGVSYGRGAAQGPAAVISASSEVELYDEVLDREPYRMGIATAEPPEGLQGAEDMNKGVYSAALSIASARQLPVGLGGDHSISPAFFHALQHSYGAASVIQFDAHSDLRETYDGTPYSHACTMSRIRRLTKDTLQIGIRSLCLEEACLVKSERVPLCTMEAFRTGAFDLQGAISALPDPVYLTMDVDVLDWSVVWSTGTPEPGGFVWHEIIELLQLIFSKRMVIGFDVVELSCGPEDINSAFAVARLVYKMLGFWLNSLVQRGMTGWPLKPSGPLIRMEEAAPDRG
ncbi:MAG: agmatinase [Desulfobacteraceae bacterium]